MVIWILRYKSLPIYPNSMKAKIHLNYVYNMPDFHFIPDEEHLLYTMFDYKIMPWVQNQNVPIAIAKKKLVQTAALYERIW